MKAKVVQVLVSLCLMLAGDLSAQWANPNPAEARIHYPRGEAPFYVRVRAYARYLDRLFERGMQNAQLNELHELGVDAAELEAIHPILSSYREREQEARSEGWRQECMPMLRGDTITEEQARAAFMRRDDAAWKEAVATQTLDELARQRGAAIAERVRRRIVERGEAIEFTTSEWAKVIEFGRGGLFVSHMMIECGTHPEYPRR